ncbi:MULTISPECIES: hypothetical protein [Salmonella]|uniref:Invasin n=20 Tax=Enterobacteriaceae TaxID=543 RepID=A0A5I9U0L4_SALPT|nr:MULTISPECIES: hypothetical protein [Salmonella]EBA0151303.1 hypothetical protein [Salmonella enterica subsp. enterica serovar Enteritidis]EHB5592703.1 hypothetical protein [Salmonella enterica subsp. enterica serovar 2,12:-:1,5]EAM7642022.1 hypothetical protein [Salmonella enterica]EAO6571577.1 hypothetical protein [Salmonella enterica]EAO7059272.1 hypothetical protein [Salmonella enterica]
MRKVKKTARPEIRLPETSTAPDSGAVFLLSMENPQLGWGFRKAFSFKPVIKTPFDLLKHLAVWQLQKFNKKSKGGPNGGRKELSAHPMEL